MKILFICTHNRCRSILSEAIINQRCHGLVEARSAGSAPAGEVHPATLQHLAQARYATDGLQSQSWDDFENFQPQMVVTVCDAAAGEACPLYFSRTLKVHWGLQDPSKIEDEAARADAFAQVIATIEERADALKRLAEAGMEGDALRVAMRELGAQ